MMRFLAIFLFCFAAIGQDINTPDFLANLQYRAAESTTGSTLTNSLWAWWKMDEYVQDGAGTNHLTDVNTTASCTGKIGLAATNSGGSSYLLSNNTNFYYTNMTVAAWFLTKTNYSQGLVGKYRTDTTNRSWALRAYTNNQIGYFISTDGTYNSAYFTAASCDTNIWVHAVGVSIGTNHYFWTNGVLAGSFTTTNSAYNCNAKIAVGNYDSGADSLKWLGAYDEVGIWNRALSTNEITQLYSNQNVGISLMQWQNTNLLSGLYSYYSMDEGSGTRNDHSNDRIDSGGTNTLADFNFVTTNLGKINYSSVFNGTSQSLETATNGTTLVNFTFACWINTGCYWTNGLTSCQFFGRDDGSKSRMYFRLISNNNARVDLRFYVATNTSAGTTITTTNNVTNAWLHVAGVYDFSNSVMRLYTNGAQASSAVITSPYTNSTTLKFAFGCRDYGSSRDLFYDGKIDMAGLWTRALSASEIGQLFTNGVNALDYQWTGSP